jgi:hypothetical protein
MNISKAKLIGIAILYLIVGSVATRGAQNMVQLNFEACMNDGLKNVKTMQDIFDLQVACMPNQITMKILFW